MTTTGPALPWRADTLLANWPLAAALLAIIAGLVMAGSAALCHWQAGELIASGDAAPLPHAHAHTSQPISPAADDALASTPAFDTQLDDLAALFKLAREQGVAIGAADYRTQHHASLPLVVRTADLRLEEEYVKVKSFVAEVLRKFPHAYLEEIGAEQWGAPSRVRAAVKLSFVYRRPG